MKRSVALLLLGCAALSAANTYGSGQLRKSLVPIPVPSNYQQRLAASAGAPGVSVGAGAPGSFEGAGAPGAPALEEIEISQPATVYKAPTRVVAQQPIRIAQPAAQYDAPAPPRRGYAGAPAKQVQKEELPEEEELTLDEEDFARNAQYSFASAVDDGIHDNSQIRQETRDGLKVTGTYAYSDGYFKRTVNYEADENGYRVVSESVEPLGEDGPQTDFVNGKAEVHTQIGGVDTQYSVDAGELAAASKRAAALEKSKKE